MRIQTLGVLLTAALALAGGTAQAAVQTYSSLGTKGSVAPSVAGVHGPTVCCGHGEWRAAAFVATATGPLAYVDVPLAYISGFNSAVVTIVPDNAGSPDMSSAPLETLEKPKLPATYKKATKIVSKTHPVLTAGTKYWLVVSPTALDGYFFWFFSNRPIADADFGTYDGGANWINSGNPSLAFDVFVQ